MEIAAKANSATDPIMETEITALIALIAAFIFWLYPHML